MLVPGVKLNASFAASTPPPGDLALISQSGALATGLVEWASVRGIGFSAIVSNFIFAAGWPWRRFADGRDVVAYRQTNKPRHGQLAFRGEPFDIRVLGRGHMQHCPPAHGQLHFRRWAPYFSTLRAARSCRRYSLASSTLALKCLMFSDSFGALSPDSCITASLCNSLC